MNKRTQLLVEELNTHIKLRNVSGIISAIDRMEHFEILEHRDALYLFDDIMNDWCTFPVSSFIKEGYNE